MKEYKNPHLEEELRLMKEKSFPYSYTLKSKNKQLLCYGLDHTGNKNNPQFKEIFDLIEKFNPECVIFERTIEEINQLKKKHKNNLPLGSGEAGIIFEKLKQDIAIIAADLNTKKLRKIISALYPNEIVQIFYFLRDMDFAICASNKTPIELIKGACPSEDFYNAVEKHIFEQTGKKINELTNNDEIYPIPIHNISILNEIRRKEDDFRDKKMVNAMITCLKKYNRVMFFAGRNHVLRHEQYLRNYFDTI